MQKKEWIKGNVENVNIVCFKNCMQLVEEVLRGIGVLWRGRVCQLRERDP